MKRNYLLSFFLIVQVVLFSCSSEPHFTSNSTEDMPEVIDVNLEESVLKEGELSIYIKSDEDNGFYFKNEILDLSKYNYEINILSKNLDAPLDRLALGNIPNVIMDETSYMLAVEILPVGFYDVNFTIFEDGVEVYNTSEENIEIVSGVKTNINFLWKIEINSQVDLSELGLSITPYINYLPEFSYISLSSNNLISNETLKLSVEIADMDGDNVTCIISWPDGTESTFTNSFTTEWVVKKNLNDGVYDILLTLSDGKSSKDITLPIEITITKTWQAFTGGSNTDWGASIARTDDGKLIVVGSTKSTNIDYVGYSGGGAYDGYIAKLDNDGSLLWQKRYGGTGDDQFSGLHIYPDGTILANGATNSIELGAFDNYKNGYAIKIDSDGVLLWERSYGGSAHDQFAKNPIGLQGTNDLILFGWRDSTTTYPFSSSTDAYVVRIDSNGVIVWENTFGGSDCDILIDGDSLSSNEIVFSGQTKSVISGSTGLSEDAYFIKVDIDGNLIWQKAYGGNVNDYIKGLHITNNGNILATGISNSTDIENTIYHGGWDGYVVYLDSNGNLLWQKLFGGTLDEYPTDIIEVEDGFIAVGTTTSTDILNTQFGGGYDIYMFKLNVEGNLMGSLLIGSENNEGLDSVIKGSNNDIYVVGGSKSSYIDENNLPAGDAAYYNIYVAKMTQDLRF